MGVPLRVRQRLGDDVVGGRLRGRVEAAGGQLEQPDRDGRAVGQAANCLGEAEVGEDRRMDPVRQVAELVDGDQEVRLRILEEPGRELGIAS